MTYFNNLGQGRVGFKAPSGGGGGVDTDAQAFITAAAITNTTQQNAINTLVTDLKGYGIWSKMKALYPFVGGTAAQHRFNLKDPRTVNAAFYLDFFGGGTHSTNGYQPNGNSYADTKLNPNLVLTSMNQHISYYSRTNISANINDNGCQDDLTSGVGRNLFAVWGPSYINYYSAQTTDSNMLTFSDTNSLGLILASRTSSTLIEGHRNGVKKTQSTALSVSPKPNINVYLGGFNYRNGAGTMSTYFGARECAFASIGDGLTDGEATNFYTAVQAYQVTLGEGRAV
jgi:hypothetical protein